MATEIEIDTIINTAGSASGLKDLRKSLKELISLQGEVGVGSDQFKKLQKAINETEGRLSDLTDSFQTLKGSGVERLNSSLGLLREGLSNADPGKLKIAFEGLHGAMSALPMFALISAISLLIENFDKVLEIVKKLTGGFSEQEKQLYELKRAYESQKVASENFITQKENELKVLQALHAEEKVANSVRREAAAEKAALAQKELDIAEAQLKVEQNRTSVLEDFYAAIQQFEAAAESKQERLQPLVDSVEKARQNLKNLQTSAFLDEVKSTEDQNNTLLNLQHQLNEAKAKNVEDERDRELAILKEAHRFEVETLKKQADEDKKNASLYNSIITEVDTKYNQDKLDIIKKYNDIQFKLIEAASKYNLEQRQKEIDAAKKQLNESREAEINDLIEYLEEDSNIKKYWAEATSQAEQDIEDKNERKRRLRRENQLAFQNAFVQKSIDENIKAIERDRDTQLLNEQLTQDQRIAIIQKAEDQIFKLKVQKGQEYVSYAQQAAAITNSINQLITQNENYELQQQQYAKDAAILNDQNRTQEELDREELRKNTLLNNASLTASERERIAYESETRQKQISKAGREAQNKLTEEFNRKELAIKKEQFERNKKLQIVTGVINTAATVLQTLASTPYPANIPLAILAGAAGAVQVGIIASQKFDDGGASARSGVSALQEIDTRGGLSSGGSPVNKDAVSPTSFDLQGNAVKQTKKVDRVSKVVVLESEIRDTSTRVDVLEERRTFGE